MRPTKLVFASCIALALAACGGSKGDPAVTMSVAVTGGTANALSTAVTTTPGTTGLTLSDGTNTLVITSAEVVLRDIELKRSDVTECQTVSAAAAPSQHALTADDGADDPANHDVADDNGDDGAENESDDRDGCEKVSTGARLVTLPLDGSVSQQIAATVPAGTYDRVEFEIHKLGADNGSDILRERPDLQDVSVHIEGTFNGTPFVFVTDESFEQRVNLAPAVVVAADSSEINVTLSIDLGSWFATDAGTLIDPNSGAGSIEDGIDGTFACFEDDNRNGRHDGDDDDEANHDAGDDNGVDGADHDVGDDNGVDGADHDVGDDNGSGGHGADDVTP